MYVLFFLISLGASVAGAICGIGGGIVIKPLLDAFGVLSVATISFLSGCTVLAMSCYSVVKRWLSGTSSIDMRTTTPLALGAAIGGVLGAILFDAVAGLFASRETVGAVQAAALALMCALILVYTLREDRVRTLHVTRVSACVAIGLGLGIVSAFLGIGGGPLNLMVLSFFFSLDTKKAAQSSLYIILFSQTFSILQRVAVGRIPVFDPWLLVLVACGGVLGGLIGQRVNRRIGNAAVRGLYIGFIVVTILINVYNVIRFVG